MDCLLPTFANCPLPTAHFAFLKTDDCWLKIDDWELMIFDLRLLIAYCLLPTVDWGLLTANCRLKTANYPLPTLHTCWLLTRLYSWQVNWRLATEDCQSNIARFSLVSRNYAPNFTQSFNYWQYFNFFHNHIRKLRKSFESISEK